ncbi:hypothetical protein V8B97DRAFT_1960691 [Scleroderma yunnanense]
MIFVRVSSVHLHLATATFTLMMAQVPPQCIALTVLPNFLSSSLTKTRQRYCFRFGRHCERRFTGCPPSVVGRTLPIRQWQLPAIVAWVRQKVAK